MLNILIIEDEQPAARRLLKMITALEPGVNLLANLDSVESGIQWLEKNSHPDLIFSDIQLSDGISFEIFKSVEPKCPVIFVTAYDQYAIDAFKVNSIDYLLKPLREEDLATALEKFRKLNKKTAALDIDSLLRAYVPQPATYKQRFVVRYGEHIRTITTAEIAYFYTEDKVNFLATFEGRRFAIDLNLDHLDTVLDPQQFFRINRQFIISISSIAEMFAHTKSRVLIKLKPPSKHETIVSAERAADFKMWLGDSR